MIYIKKERNLSMNKFRILSDLLDSPLTVQSSEDDTTAFTVKHEVAISDANAVHGDVMLIHITDKLGAEYSIPLSHAVIVKLPN